jgi:hypothetical protein
MASCKCPIMSCVLSWDSWSCLFSVSRDFMAFLSASNSDSATIIQSRKGLIWVCTISLNCFSILDNADPARASAPRAANSANPPNNSPTKSLPSHINGICSVKDHTPNNLSAKMLLEKCRGPFARRFRCSLAIMLAAGPNKCMPFTFVNV